MCGFLLDSINPWIVTTVAAVEYTSGGVHTNVRLRCVDFLSAYY